MNAVELNRVSKKLSLHQSHPRSFRDALISLTSTRSGRAADDEFWALRDLSFTIEQGETVGFVGPNGAGKSSLLKLIAGIFEPTSGRVNVQGRVSALLELGTGFHPELSGRENIYLSGAIMGFDRQTMSRSYERIVAFSGLERFIDAPVKHYSSGMYVRLGFSVAIHVDPEILLIDEVLSVGDQTFQARCMEKIRELQERGTTIVLVSHDLGSVRRICRRSIWLEDGKLMFDGETDTTLNRYMESIWSSNEPSDTPHGQMGRRWGSGEAVVERVEFLDAEERPTSTFRSGDKLIARIWYRADHAITKPSFGTAIYRDDGTHVTGPNTALSHFDIASIQGYGYLDYVIDDLPLVPGHYEFTAAIYDYHSTHPYDHRHRQFAFRVVRGSSHDDEGVVIIPCHWEHVIVSASGAD